MVGSHQPDSLALLDLHDLLHDTVLHKVVDLGIVNGLPVLHEFLQCILKLKLKVVDVVNLIIRLSTEGLKNREVRVEVTRVLIIQLSVVVLHDVLEGLNIAIDGGSAVSATVLYGTRCSTLIEVLLQANLALR